MRHCLKKRNLSFTPASDLYVTTRPGSESWRDYAVQAWPLVSSGHAFLFRLYYQDEDNWYGVTLDYENQRVVLEECLAGVVTELAEMDQRLVPNAVYPTLAEVIVDPRTRIPAVFYDPCTGSFNSFWEVFGGSPAYDSGSLLLDVGDQVLAREDVTGPCLTRPDTLAAACGCSSIASPAVDLFDMSDYAVSAVIEADHASSLLHAFARWDWSSRSGVRIAFDWGADLVTIAEVGPGGVVGASTAAAMTLDPATPYTVWTIVDGDQVQVWRDSGGLPVKVVETTTAHTDGRLGFEAAVSGPADFSVQITDPLCVPLHSERYSCPWLINFRDNGWLQTRDGSSGALDGIVIASNQESRNLLRATVSGQEISAYSRSFTAGRVGAGTDGSTYGNLNLILIGPIKTACRDLIMI